VNKNKTDSPALITATTVKKRALQNLVLTLILPSFVKKN